MRKWVFLALVAVLLAALAAWMRKESALDHDWSPTIAVQSATPHGGVPLLTPRANDREQRSEVGPATQTDSQSEPAVSADHAATDDDEEWISFAFVEEPNDAALPDAEITLRVDSKSRSFIADEKGLLDVATTELPAELGQLVFITVKDKDGNRRLEAWMTLQPTTTIRVPAKLMLRGEIVLASGSSPAGLSVSLWLPAGGIYSVERFVANKDLDATGRFEFGVGDAQVPAMYTVRVAGVGIPAAVSVPTADLIAPAGARVVISLARLHVIVRDELGDPVERAHVRCMATDSTDGHSPLFADATTGSEGRARTWVPGGPIAIAVGSERHAPGSENVIVGDADTELTFRLRSLTVTDRITGTVVFEDETPVEGATVSACCHDHAGDLGVVSMRQMRTDELGRFEIAIATDQDLDLYAFHKEHGESAEVLVSPGAGPVRLVIDRGVSLRLVGRGLESQTLSGSSEFLLVIVHEDGHSDEVGTNRLPFTFERVTPGRWRVFALAAKQQRWATGEIVVTREGPAEFALDFVPLEFIEGRVDGPSGSRRAIGVMLTPENWPEIAAKSLLAAPIELGGRFRVAAPAPGELALFDSQKVLDRRPARGGASVEFVLPD